MFLETQNIQIGLESPIVVFHNNLRRAINSLNVLSDNCDFHGKELEGVWNKRGPLMASLPGVDLIGLDPPSSDHLGVFL